jgi:hypothetical protein
MWYVVLLGLWFGVGLVFVIHCVVCLLRYGLPWDFRAVEIALVLGILFLGWPVIFIIDKSVGENAKDRGPQKKARALLVVGSGHPTSVPVIRNQKGVCQVSAPPAARIEW